MHRIRKCVIPVAGYGTRMYPASKALKKEMFPVVDAAGRAKPVLQLIMEEAVDSGIEAICLIAQPGDEALFRGYFSDDLPEAWRAKLHARDWARAETERLADLGRRLTCVEQTAQDGFGHAVYAARAWLGGEPFLLMLGDHLYVADGARRCAAQLLERHAQLGGTVVAVEQAAEEELPLRGTVRGEPLAGDGGVYRVAEFAEKPAAEFARRNLRTPGLADGRYLCVFGQYALAPEVMDILGDHIRRDVREGGEIQFTAALEAMRRQGGSCHALETRGRRFDTGVPCEYARTVHALQMRPRSPVTSSRGVVPSGRGSTGSSPATHPAGSDGRRMG